MSDNSWANIATRSSRAALATLLAIALSNSCALPEVTGVPITETAATGAQPAAESGTLVDEPNGVAEAPAGPAADGQDASAAGQQGTGNAPPREGGRSGDAGEVAQQQPASTATAGTNAANGGATGATAGASGADDSSASVPTTPATDPEAMRGCSPASNPDTDGSFVPAHVENAGPDGKSWVYFPQQLGKDGARHAVLVFAPQAGAGPSSYLTHLNRLASHGFVTITQPTSDDGSAEKAAIDWLSAENATSSSQFFGKLDLERIAAGGHSKGSLTTFKIASDPRIRLFVFICGGSGSGTTGAMSIQEYTLLLGGADDTSATPNFEADFAAIDGPTFFITKDATGLTDCAKNNLEPWVAFMRWRFCAGPGGGFTNNETARYCTAPWTCKMSSRI